MDTAFDAHIRAGRTLKFRARDAAASDRAKLFELASAEYAAAADLTPSTYALINAASLSLLAGKANRAREQARMVLQMLKTGAHQPDTPYWLAATRAEAELVLGDFAAAQSSMEAAIHAHPRAWEDHAITRRQFRQIYSVLEEDAAWLDALPSPQVLYFGGLMEIDPADRATRDAIKGIIEEISPAVGYGALAAGADILTAEALVDFGADLHVVLPCDRDLFRQTSVISVDPAWGPKYDACIDAAASIDVVAEDPVLAIEPIRLAADVAMGMAIACASEICGRSLALQVTDAGQRSRALQPSWDKWAAAGRPVEALEVVRSMAAKAPIKDGSARAFALLSMVGAEASDQIFDTIAAALSEAGRCQDSLAGLDYRVCTTAPTEDDFALARQAASVPLEPGLYASMTAANVAILECPDAAAEIAGAARHALGESDIYRLKIRSARRQNFAFSTES